jgi:hypothetical protein
MTLQYPHQDLPGFVPRRHSVRRAGGFVQAGLRHNNLFRVLLQGSDNLPCNLNLKSIKHL